MNMDSVSYKSENIASNIIFPEDLNDTNKEYYLLLEVLIAQLPSNTFLIKWIKGEKGETYYCNIVITEEEQRRTILATIEDLFQNSKHLLDCYVIGQQSICVVGRTENGPEVSRSLVTCDG